MTSSTNDQDKPAAPSNKAGNHALSRRNILLGSSALVRLATMRTSWKARWMASNAGESFKKTLDRIRGGLNRMIDEQIQQRGVK